MMQKNDSWDQSPDSSRYDGPSSREKTPPRRGAGKYLLLGCGGCAVLMMIFLLGGGLLARLGMAVFVDQVEADIRENPVIVEHLGRLEEFELEFMASMAASGDDVYVFRAEGTKGTGRVTATCITVDSDSEDVVAGTLQLSSGKTVDLFPEYQSGD
jgi:hypothetical protein